MERGLSVRSSSVKPQRGLLGLKLANQQTGVLRIRNPRSSQPLGNRRDYFLALRFSEFAVDRNTQHLARDTMRDIAA